MYSRLTHIMDDVVVGLRLIVDIAPAQHTSSVHGTALRRCKPPVHVLQAELERCGSLIQARQERDPQHGELSEGWFAEVCASTSLLILSSCRLYC